MTLKQQVKTEEAPVMMPGTFELFTIVILWKSVRLHDTGNAIPYRTFIVIIISSSKHFACPLFFKDHS